jgi:hypothetical protein
MSTKDVKKNFISINEGFICKNCGKKNGILKGGCRNHCTKCLHSLHVDENIPGDRNSQCRGVMEPVEVEKNGKKGYMIVHKCSKCAKISRNKCAYDDDFDAIIKLSRCKLI